MKKRNKILLLVAIIIVVIATAILLWFLPVPMTFLNRDLKNLQMSEVSAVEVVQSPSCGPQEGPTLSKIITDTQQINTFIDTLRQTKLKRNYHLICGGCEISIIITKKDGSRIDIEFCQGFYASTKYRIQGDALSNEIDKHIHY